MSEIKRFCPTNGTVTAQQGSATYSENQLQTLSERSAVRFPGSSKSMEMSYA
jgi:hypothetical protein